MLRIIVRTIFWFKNLLMGICCLGLAIYGFYWLNFTPTDQPFGLFELLDASHGPKISPKTLKKQRLRFPMPSAVSDNDILASEHDEGSGKIKELNSDLIDTILKDKGYRVSDEFSIPQDLRKRVEFWFKIYTTYTISHAVLHDNEHPWIIYEVVNLNSVYNKYKLASQRNMAKAEMIRNARYTYKNILDKLAKRSNYILLSKEEKRIYDLFKDIPGPRNQVFANAKNDIRLQLGQKDSLLYGIKQSGRYLKTMESIFGKNDLPLELTRIPFLESSFNLNAYSKDGASGIWQFMSKTGKVFLTVSYAQGIDERNHPLKATEAAARLLKQNYQVLKNWPLAVTAYNHGPGGLLKGAKKVGSRNLNDLIERYRDPYFAFASKNFYSCFLAVVHAERYQDKVFGYVEKENHLEHEDIDIKYSMRVKYIMELCGLTQKEIKLYNPDLRSKVLNSQTYLPEGYLLKLPKGKRKPLLAFYEEVAETNRILDEMLGEEE
ncbi:MAG: lytic transglycosylase domain-containing protein [Deltaproteobacteria bacterium]|nr:lytic transglycosylase domain-containing protein [Deltaproteobacteria bacterium]